MVDRLMTYDIVLQDRTGQVDCAFFSDRIVYLMIDDRWI